ncbi:MAG TPA: HAD-IC family P-type ATPase, partial [Flavobacteriales bacterium]|nr:HAD-IC family P-type ATPase [Flavobacteriales bacterium]
PRLIDAVARRFTMAVLLIALGAGLYWWGRDPGQVWPVITAVLIVACPCALALSMPFAYGHTVRWMGKRGLFLRDAEVVERMAHTDLVVFDKTGTLTAREAHSVAWTGAPLTAVQRSMVRSLARSSTHPLSAVLHAHLRDGLLSAERVHESPGKGIEGLLHEVPVRIGSALYCGAKEVERSNGEAVVFVRIGNEVPGHFRITKQARAGVVEAVDALHGNVATALLTGDDRVAEELAKHFRPEDIRTGCSPADKSRFIAERQEAGHRVMMVGDGLNDAAALGRSDVGITVTETSAALTPASDAILDADAIARLPQFLHMARRARRIVFASLGISLCYNVVGVSLAVAGQMSPLIAAVLMPLSSVSVVGFVTLAVWLGGRRAS